jgi:hypothetical protein
LSGYHSRCVEQETYLAQWFWLVWGTLFTRLATFCFGRHVCVRFYHHIIFGEFGDIGGNDSMPKVTDSTSFFMDSMLIQEAEEEISSLSNERPFGHGRGGAGTRGQGNKMVSASQ